MATSKEKKRYHLEATNEGWKEAGSGSGDHGPPKGTPRPRPQAPPKKP